MKKLFMYFLLSCLCISFIPAQKLTTGIVSGSNFAYTKGDIQSNDWKIKTGSISGIWFNYAFNQVISIGTEINYTSMYYQFGIHQSYIGPYYNMSDIMQPQYYSNLNWNFNFYRIPVYLKLSTPTKLRFEVSGGIYYSFLQQPNTDPGINSNYSGDIYPKSDVGSIFSAGFAYPITRHVEAFVQGRYTTGSKEYISYNHGKLGTSELVFGIGYSGIFNKMKDISRKVSMKDSSDCQFSMKYRSGVNISWIEADKNAKSYSSKAGFTSGVVLNYSLGENCGVQAELLYENKGYQLSDSTSSSFRYVPNLNKYANTYYTNTRIETSYFTFPVLFEIKSSGPIRIYCNTGPYFSTLLNAKSTGYQVNEYRSDGSYYSKSKISANDNISNIITPTDWGWIVGGGVQIPLIYNWKLDIEGRYEGSWSNILNLPPSPSAIPEFGSTRTMTNRSITLLVGLHVPIY